MVDFFVANQLNEIRIDIFTWVRNFTWPLSVWGEVAWSTLNIRFSRALLDNLGKDVDGVTQNHVTFPFSQQTAISFGISISHCIAKWATMGFNQKACPDKYRQCFHTGLLSLAQSSKETQICTPLCVHICKHILNTSVRLSKCVFCSCLE